MRGCARCDSNAFATTSRTFARTSIASSPRRHDELTSGDGAWQRIDLGSAEVANARARVDGVLRDRDGALWIRSPSHLWLLPKGATRATDLHDGLPDSFIVAGVSTGMAISPRGHVLLGTEDGIAYRDQGRWRLIDRSIGMPARQSRT